MGHRMFINRKKFDFHKKTKLFFEFIHYWATLYFAQFIFSVEAWSVSGKKNKLFLGEVFEREWNQDFSILLFNRWT